jgi:hypothetical protein
MLCVPIRYLEIFSKSTRDSEHTTYHKALESQLFLQDAIEKLAVLTSVGVVHTLV